MSDAKPGWKTTEFWQSTAVALTSLVVGAGVQVPTLTVPIINAAGDAAKTVTQTTGPWWMKAIAFLGAAIASYGYSKSRGQAKSGDAPSPC